MNDFSAESLANNPANNPAASYPPGFDPEAYHAQLFGPWQLGRELVMLKDEPLPPNRCVASGEAADYRRRLRFAWHPPGYYFLIFLGLLPYAIVASFMTQKATIDVPLGNAWRARRRRMIWLGFLLITCGIFLTVASPTLDKIVKEWGWVTLTGIIVFIFGLDRAINGARPLKPAKITESMIWLKGAGPKYLASLPLFLGEHGIPASPLPYPSTPSMPRASPGVRPPPLPPGGGRS